MTEETPHPIRLNQVWFVRSVVVAVPGHQPREGLAPTVPENRIDVSEVEGQPWHYEATMRTTINLNMDRVFPYMIHMECVAMLTADSSLGKDDALSGVTISAHSVLYGAIREAVAWLTGRQPYGPLLLGLSVLKAPPQTTPASPAMP